MDGREPAAVDAVGQSAHEREGARYAEQSRSGSAADQKAKGSKENRPPSAFRQQISDEKQGINLEQAGERQSQAARAVPTLLKAPPRYYHHQ